MSSSDEADNSDREYMPTNEESGQSESDYDSDECDSFTDDVVEGDDIDFVGDEDGFTFVVGDDQRATYPPFTGQTAGPTDPERLYADEVEVFKAFIDDEIANFIVDCSNAKAAEFISVKGSDKINGVHWSPMTVQDLYVFIALVLKMGISHEPKISDYWHDHPLHGGSILFSSRVMSRSRFRNISKFLRFGRPVPNRKAEAGDRIEQFLEKLRKKCKDLLHPGCHIAIDEALILWKGRLFFKQFIKTKRARFGIKIFFLCPGSHDWQGYSCNFNVYYGKDIDIEVDIDPIAAAAIGKTGRVVVNLLGDLIGEGRHVVVDNWYTSQKLAAYLVSENTMLTGTINPLRGVPLLLRESNLIRGQTAMMRKGVHLCIKYQDKGQVFVHTTRYTGDFVPAPRFIPGQGRIHYKKPHAVEQYNNFMGGVDKADQLLKYYKFDRKSLAWFKKLGIHFIQRMCLNAYIIWKNQRKEHMEFLEYLKCLIEGLLMKHSEGAAQILTQYKQSKPPRPQRGRRARRPSVQSTRTRSQLQRQARPEPNPRGRSPPPTLPPLEPQAGSSSAPQPGAAQSPSLAGYQPLAPTASPVKLPAGVSVRQSPEQTVILTELLPRQRLVVESSPAVVELAPAVVEPAVVEPAAADSYQPRYHQLTKIPSTQGSKHPRKRCRQHYLEGGPTKRKDTNKQCLLCDGQPGLCSPACFDKYHEKIGFAVHLRVVTPPVRVRGRALRLGRGHLAEQESDPDDPQAHSATSSPSPQPGPSSQPEPITRSSKRQRGSPAPTKSLSPNKRRRRGLSAPTDAAGSYILPPSSDSARSDSATSDSAASDDE